MSSRERRLTLDQQPIKRLTDYLGTFRTVAFCTEDLALVKGAGRAAAVFWISLTQTVPGYLHLLQRYTRAVRARNALLKRKPIDEAALNSFTTEVIQLGNQLIAHRHDLMPTLGPRIQAAHKRIAPNGEELRVELIPSVKNDFSAELELTRDRERKMEPPSLGHTEMK